MDVTDNGFSDFWEIMTYKWSQGASEFICSSSICPKKQIRGVLYGEEERCDKNILSDIIVENFFCHLFTLWNVTSSKFK